MNINQLKEKLFTYNVPEHWYSIDEGLKSDACILFKNYSKWEFFYLDERGNRNEFKIFTHKEDAFDYLWKKMEYQLEIFKILLRNEVK